MKYKRIILIFSIFILFSIASVSAGEVDDKVMMSDENPEIESTSIEKDLKITDNQVLSKTNDDEIQSVKDNEIIGEDSDSNTNATFNDLKKEIGEGGNITLTHKFYNYDGTGQESEFIEIKVANSVIDGNGAVINMNGSHTQVFQIKSDNVTIKNLTITNGNFEPESSWYFIYVPSNDAKILDCNFIDNNGHLKGVIFVEDNINCAVTNCTFINNKGDQYSWGGAIFNNNGNVAVTNCYFSGNSAREGSDIYSDGSSVTVDTCIFKDSGTTVNVQIVPPTLNVDDFVTLNNSGEKLTFDLKTNSGMSVNNGNISISVYDNNDTLIGEYSCLSSEGWVVNLPVGSYYAIFNTEYAGFEAINRTITVIPNTEYYINVTPVTTSNKTVTISAKSNIPTDIIGGRLVFILPNGDELNGTYDSNGTWMVVHTFDKYGTYEINATYTNFKMATVNSATITVRKTNSTIDLGDIVLDYPESENVTVITEGATSITAKIDGKSISVINNFTIPILDLDAGNYTLAVTTIPDETHLAVTKTVTITVNKASVKIVASDLELKLDDKSKVNYALEPEEATGRIYFISDNPEVANVASDGNITALSAGTANITITFEGNKNYEKTTKTIKIKVNKANSTLTIPSQELEYKPSLNITVDATGATGIIAKINGKDTKTDGFTIEIPVDAGIYTLNVTTIPDKNHNPITKTTNITVNKVDTKIGANDLELAFGEKTKLIYVLMPEYAEGNITFSSSNPDVANVSTIGEVTALSAGTANITITFEGNKNYEKTTKTIKIKVNKANSTLTIPSQELEYKPSLNITVDATGATGITAKINGKDTKTDGFTIEIPVDAGIYTLNVTTIPDKNHNPITKTTNITVNKASVKIVASDLELKLDDKSKVNYALEPEDVKGQIYFEIDNPEVANVASDGNITALSAGTANITITFEGNKNYEKTTKTIKIKVNKANSTLTIPSQELEYKPSLNITVDATGATGIIAKINGKDTKTDGFTIEIPVDAGIYTLNVTTIPDKNHNPITKTTNITVNKVDTKIGANDLELAFGEKTKLIYVLMPEYAEGNITFSSSNPDVANVSTIGEVTALSAGTANITITFEGNKNYEKTTKTIKIKVNKANSTLTIPSQELEYKPSLNITVDATGATGITAKIDGKDAKVNGYTIEIPVLNAGSHTLTVTTIPEENYNAVTENATITVRKINSTLTVNNVTFDYKSIGSTTVTFTGATGVNATVLNQYQANVTVNGTNITISNLNAGKYTLQVTTIAEYNYNPITKTASITVNKLKTTLNAKSIATVYNVNKNLVITLKDSKGNALNGVNITVQLKDAKTYTTNKNGQIKVSTKGLAPKVYTAKITFKGNTNYEKTSKNTVKVTIKKATPKITAKKKTFKRTVKTKKYNIALKTNLKKAMKGVKVTLKVNKKTYSAKTNKKGIATFKITKLTKTGKYTATVKFAGNKYYNAKAVKQKIIVK